MKKLILLFTVVIFYSKFGFAQDFSNLKSLTLKDSIECKMAESQVLECSTFLLTQPCVENLNSLNATQFILKWMGQTPDYQFGFEDELYKSVKSNLMLMGRYLACQATIAINNKPKNNGQDFKYNYIKMFLEYCEKPQNGVKMNSKLKKLVEAKNENKLMEALEKK
jgi:hypothetical protein